MIPEPDQLFTEIELSTLEKAINETEVSAATMLGIPALPMQQQAALGLGAALNPKKHRRLLLQDVSVLFLSPRSFFGAGGQFPKVTLLHMAQPGFVASPIPQAALLNSTAIGLYRMKW